MWTESAQSCSHALNMPHEGRGNGRSNKPVFPQPRLSLLTDKHSKGPESHTSGACPAPWFNGEWRWRGLPNLTQKKGQIVLPLLVLGTQAAVCSHASRHMHTSHQSHCLFTLFCWAWVTVWTSRLTMEQGKGNRHPLIHFLRHFQQNIMWKKEKWLATATISQQAVFSV